MGTISKLCLFSALACSTRAEPFVTKAGNQFEIFNDPGNDRALFKVRVKENNYVAVGIGCTSMVKCDMALFQGSPDGWKVTDLWSTGFYKPEEKGSQKFQGTGNLEDGAYII